MSDAVKTTEAPKEIFRKDYCPPAFMIETVNLDFQLDEHKTRVTARTTFERQDETARDLKLDGGKDLKLISVALDGAPLGEGDYRLEDGDLFISGVPDTFTLEIITEIDPAANTALSGLYVSGGNFCTQCEAEGFRNITYYLDRPDVMARYCVRIEADESAYPVLLSNGNQVEGGMIGDGPGAKRHYAIWDDPHPKPSYLFALVAGDLGCLADSFTTCSGREVTLKIWAAGDDLDKCDHAMASLKRSMAWDEKAFGLEYDLDIYNIVAIGDFNMGAMENKSLNVFNTKYVLASGDTATDRDFEGVEGVIAHEYFHNWTGNRVTCRDWFQLSLKEGLTVFRDQEYSSNQGSRALKRIEDVRVLRSHQFAEDSGPMAHSVRPDSYIEINNFYTATVYSKGAEVIRMMHRLLGPENFRKGMDLYFERHDGRAVTCDDFASAMEDASGVDLGQFRLWYSQAGTPTLTVSTDYDAEAKVFRLTVGQSCPPTPGQPDKKPMHMPLAMGLIGADGANMDATLYDGGRRIGDDFVLQVRDAEQTFEFHNVPERPVPSLLRGFSAPVHLTSDLTREDRLFLLAHDSDSFARWEAGQSLATDMILKIVIDLAAGREAVVDQAFTDAVARVMADETSDKALIAEALTLPSEGYIGQLMETVDVDGIHEARTAVQRHLAVALYNQWLALYRALSSNAPYDLGREEKARRALRNVALSYLVKSDRPEGAQLALEQFHSTDNMTEAMGALAPLAGSTSTERDVALGAFYDQWQSDPLVVDKWFAVQAAAGRDGVLQDVLELRTHDAFTLTNPNRVRSLIAVFSILNPAGFHHASGGGYRLLTDVVVGLNARNPQLAARLVQPLIQWRRYDETRQAMMRSELERILDTSDLSRDVFELVKKSLG